MSSLGRLRKIVQDVSSASTLDDALRLITEQAKEVMSVDVCSIYLKDIDCQDMVLTCTDGLDQSAIGLVRMPIGDGLVGTIAQHQQVLNTDDAVRHPNFHYFPETHEEDYHAFLGVPIVHFREVVGVLVVQQRDIRQFNDEDEAFLVTMAAQLSGTLGHAMNSGKVSALLQKGKKANTFVDGIVGSSGVGIGKVALAGGNVSFKDVEEICALDQLAELSEFSRALNSVRQELDAGYQQMADTPGDVQAIFEAYRMILESDDLQQSVKQKISDGLVAPAALKVVIDELASIFEAMDDPYFQARGEDIRNIGLRILRYLIEPNAVPIQHEQPIILIGDIVSVSDIAEIPTEKLAGIVCQQGSSLSHTAILAGALGVPAVMGVGELPQRKLSGQTAILDGYRGRVHFQPSSALMAEYIRLARQEDEFDRSLDKIRDMPAETPDGKRFSLLVNTGLLADISPGLEKGAEGVGLYRTEIPFMIHDTFPSEQLQFQTYRKVLEEFHPRPVTMRTLDIGGDKPLPYFPVEEDNPYLGWRGIRFTLDHPEIFAGQLRAMLRASEGLNNLRIMLPMVSSVEEVDSFLELLDKKMEVLEEEGVKVKRPPVGIMVEVPSTMFLLDFLAPKLDFISIGTNDLTQYLLAVDRNNDQVARLFSRLHPAVLRALAMISKRSKTLGLELCLCGELAADPVAVLLIMGLGLDSLSMNAHSLPRMKHVIRSFTQEEAEGLLEKALTMRSEAEIRAMLNQVLDDRGLGGLIRSGV